MAVQTRVLMTVQTSVVMTVQTNVFMLYIVNLYVYIYIYIYILYCIIGGGIARFTRVLFEHPCYLQFEQEIHIVEVSYFTNILIK